MPHVDWSGLHHAYGAATDIPVLLASARHAPVTDRSAAEPWHSLWSALCHQNDVFPASYAAVPELIRIASERRDSGGIEALLLAATIELQRLGPGAPPLPDVIRDAYLASVAEGAILAATLHGVGERPDDPRRLEIAAAACSGDLMRARELYGDTEGE